MVVRGEIRGQIEGRGERVISVPAGAAGVSGYRNIYLESLATPSAVGLVIDALIPYVPA